MINKLILIINMLLIVISLSAQTIITGVVKDSLNKPIPFANVYLVKTTIGTITDTEGRYMLKILQEGRYQLFATCVGYNTNGLEIEADGRKQNIDIKLKLNYFRINEVTIRASEQYKKRYYNFFVRQFIGQTTNSLRCKITNPEDLHLYKDKETEILKGFSIKPLRIENKALGYTIIYDLAVFKYDPTSGIIQFAGNPYFQESVGSIRKIKTWQQNRLKTYNRSRMHFIRALFVDSLAKENYQIFESDSVINKKTGDTIKELSVENVAYPGDRLSKTLFNKKPLYINFKDLHPEIKYSPTLTQFELHKSSMDFLDSIKIYQNGMFEPYTSVLWNGSMAFERMADMLPYDYQPQNFKDHDSNTNIIADKSDIRKDQVFVQTDRNLYNPGDTIYFQAYIMDKVTGEFESGSVSLYALLFNEQKQLADSSRFRIKNAVSSGWMAIPKKAKPGIYRFAAFTGNMQNGNPKEAFQLDLKVDTFSVFTKQPYEIEKYSDKMSLEKNSDISVKEQYINLKFLPEGDTLITGLEQRIGFNATDSTGEPVYIEALLKKNNGEVIDTIKSGSYGPGLFTCKPEKGMYAELINGSYNRKKWSLPDCSDNGISLSVKPVNKRSFIAELQSNSYKGEKLVINGSMNNTTIFLQEITFNKKTRITINTGELPSGALQITVFDSVMRPIANRLIYVNADEHLKFNIYADKAIYQPGQETELYITVTDGQGYPEKATFSISVIDAKSGVNSELFNPGIEHTFNYQPYFFENLPSKVLLKGLENISDEQRDLLLMVYGLTNILPDSTKKDWVNYEMMNMKILSSSKTEGKERGLDLVSLEKLFIRQFVTNNNGECTLPLDSLDNEIKTVVMVPDSESKKQVSGAGLNVPFNEKFFDHEYYQTILPTINWEKFNSSVYSKQNIIVDSIASIPEVGSLKYLINNYSAKDEVPNQESKVKYISREQIWSSLTVEEAVRKVITPYAVSGGYIYINPPVSIPGESFPAYIVIEGDPVGYKVWNMVNEIPTNELESIIILTNSKGISIHDKEVEGGIIFLNVLKNYHDLSLAKKYKKWISKSKEDKMFVPFNIYRPTVEFYNPGKVELNSSSQSLNRPTIYWQSTVYFDGQNPEKIKIPNPNHEGTIIITINGVSENNLSGTGKAYYKIQKNIPKKTK